MEANLEQPKSMFLISFMFSFCDESSVASSYIYNEILLVTVSNLVTDSEKLDKDVLHAHHCANCVQSLHTLHISVVCNRM